MKVLYDALKARAGMKMRVLVGMEAEMAMGNLVGSLRKEGDNSANAIKNLFCESMRKIVGSSEVDTKAEEALKYFDDMWEKAIPLTATEEDRIKLIKLLRDASVARPVAVPGDPNTLIPGFQG